MIDLGCVDPNEVIDITSICMTGHYNLNVHQRHYGVNLTEDVCILIFVFLTNNLQKVKPFLIRWKMPFKV